MSPTLTGYGTAAVPHTTHVPIPTTPATYTGTPRPSTSPFAGKPVVEFTPQQLARAGYRVAGTGSGPGRARTDRQTKRNPDGTPAVTQVDRARIVTMYEAGSSIAAIHRETGYAHATIRRHLDAAGIGRDATRSERRITEAGAREAERLYAEGLSLRQVGQRVGLSHAGVGRLLRRRGVDVRDRNASANDEGTE